MFRLVLLGDLALTSTDAPDTAIALRRRLLALLALIAGGGKLGVPREQLLLYLWPESATAKARTSLSTAIFSLRQVLGADAIQGTSTLRLNPSLVTCDLWDFEEAIENGRLEAAAAAYGGELLGGFSLTNAPELDRWIDTERERRQQQVVQAFDRLARASEERGDLEDAATWLRRAALEAPYDARIIVELMRLLARMNNATEAVHIGERYNRFVRDNLGAEPEPAVLELMTQLRDDLSFEAPHPERNGTTRKSRKAAARAATAMGRVPATGISVPNAPADFSVGVSLPNSGSARSQTKPSRHPILVALAVALTGIIVIAAVLHRRTAETPARPAADVAMVFPFVATGSEVSSGMAREIAELLTGSLDGVGGERVLGPNSRGSLAEPPTPFGAASAAQAREVALKAGVKHFILGDVFESGEKLRLRVGMYTTSQPVDSAPPAIVVEGRSADLFTLVDSAVVRLLLQRIGAESVESDLSKINVPLGALRAFLDGEAAMAVDRPALAIEGYRRAIEQSPQFALAYFRMGVAANAAGRLRLSEESVERAAALADLLPERERMLITAQRREGEGRLGEAEEIYRQLCAAFPDDAEVWADYGRLLFHANPLRGRSVEESRPMFERANRIAPDNVEILVYLARLAALQGRGRDAEHLANRAKSLAKVGELVELRAFRAFLLGDRPGLKHVTRDIASEPAAYSDLPALQVAVYADNLALTEQFADGLAANGLTQSTRAFGQRLRSQVSMARGQVKQALARLDEASAMEQIPALELASVYASSDVFRIDVNRAREVRNQVRSWNATNDPDEDIHSDAHQGLHPAMRLYAIGTLSLRLGDAPAAQTALDSLKHLPGDARTRSYADGLAATLHARMLSYAHRDAEALAELDRANWPRMAEVFTSEVDARMFRAQLLERLGRVDEAVSWLGSIAQRGAYELVYLAPAELMQAQMLERAGRSGQAVRHYTRFVQLWDHADPTLADLVSQAREHMNSLSARK